ncbi:hypothetical protein ACLKA6_007376 [Drosophila palustris]
MATNDGAGTIEAQPAVRSPQVIGHQTVIYGGHGQSGQRCNTFLVERSKKRRQRQQRQPTMENSVIAVEAKRRCRIWHMRVARAVDAH